MVIETARISQEEGVPQSWQNEFMACRSGSGSWAAGTFRIVHQARGRLTRVQNYL